MTTRATRGAQHEPFKWMAKHRETGEQRIAKRLDGPRTWDDVYEMRVEFQDGSRDWVQQWVEAEDQSVNDQDTDVIVLSSSSSDEDEPQEEPAKRQRVSNGGKKQEGRGSTSADAGDEADAAVPPPAARSPAAAGVAGSSFSYEASAAPADEAVPRTPAFEYRPWIGTQRCGLLGCDECATHPHPIVHGLGVCAMHMERISLLSAQTTRGECAIAAAERERKGEPAPDAEIHFCCNSLGCQIGFRRPCCVCGGGGGDGDEDDDDDDLSPCLAAGCTAWAHDACREMLSRRVCVYWEGNKDWFWGLASRAALCTQTVVYDDGDTRPDEDLGQPSRQLVQWLINPAQSAIGGACICAAGCATPSSKLADMISACAVCCTQDVRVGEAGQTNEIVYCGECSVGVHIWCYGQTSEGDMFGGAKSVGHPDFHFVCDHCRHLQRGNAPAACVMCPRVGGWMRPLMNKDGQWAHLACRAYHPGVKFGQWQSPSHRAHALCRRGSGCTTCFKSKMVVTEVLKTPKVSWQGSSHSAICTHHCTCLVFSD